MLKLGKQKTDYPDRKSATFYAGGCCGCCCCCYFWFGGVIGMGLGLLYAKESWDKEKAESRNQQVIRLARIWFWSAVLGSLVISALASFAGNEVSKGLWLVSPVWNVLLAIILVAVRISRADVESSPEVRSLILKRNIFTFFMTLVGYAAGWMIVLASA